MTQHVKAHISFEFSKQSIEEVMDITDMTDKELEDYARETFIEDIYQLVKYNELEKAVKTEFIENK